MRRRVMLHGRPGPGKRRRAQPTCWFASPDRRRPSSAAAAAAGPRQQPMVPNTDPTRPRAPWAAAFLAAGLWAALVLLVLRLPPDGREHAAGR